MDGQVVWLCRHGERLDHVNPAFGGDDPQLSTTGIIQAKETGTRLKDEGITRIFASPFLRTVQTAFFIAEAINVPIRIEWGLCEWLNKDWFSEKPKLRSIDALCNGFDHIDPTHRSLLLPSFPEDGEQASVRAGETARRLADAYPNESILLVGHAHSVMGMASGLLGAPCSAPCDYACLFKIVRDGKNASLQIAGATDHLSLKETPRER